MSPAATRKIGILLVVGACVLVGLILARINHPSTPETRAQGVDVPDAGRPVHVAREKALWGMEDLAAPQVPVTRPSPRGPVLQP